MERLRKVIEQHGRWSVYSVYIDRIEAHLMSDFSLCIENSKSLIEGISKQICKEKGFVLSGYESFNKLIKNAFDAVGYQPGECINVIGGSLSAIAQQIGNLRTAMGSISHGKTVDELSNRNEMVDALSKDFLIDAIVIISCFLIRCFENENPRKTIDTEHTLEYEDAEDFNESWDDSFGEFEMGDYSYTASEILFSVDKEAYVNEYNAFIENQTE